jgi:hypothetical protein
LTEEFLDCLAATPYNFIFLKEDRGKTNPKIPVSK